MLTAKQATTSAIESACAILKDRSRMFFAILPMETSGLPGGAGRMPFHNREAFLEESGDFYTGVLNALTRLEGELDYLKNVEESPACANEPQTSAVILLSCSNRTDRNTVFWIERRAAGGVRNLRARRSSRSLSHAPPGHSHRRLRAPHQHALRQLQLGHPHLRDAHGLRRLRSHPPPPRPHLDERASCPLALQLRKTGASLPPAQHARSARARLPRKGRRAHPPCS